MRLFSFLALHAISVALLDPTYDDDHIARSLLEKMTLEETKARFDRMGGAAPGTGAQSVD